MNIPENTRTVTIEELAEKVLDTARHFNPICKAVARHHSNNKIPGTPSEVATYLLFLSGQMIHSSHPEEDVRISLVEMCLACMEMAVNLLTIDPGEHHFKNASMATLLRDKPETSQKELNRRMKAGMSSFDSILKIIDGPDAKLDKDTGQVATNLFPDDIAVMCAATAGSIVAVTSEDITKNLEEARRFIVQGVMLCDTPTSM